MSNGVFLLLGSNQGHRKENLERAMHEIERSVGPITRRSSLYETEPWGNTDQDPFYNMVICVASQLKPQALLGAVLEIERLLGRKRAEHWGPRVIDIDILYYDDQVVRAPGLSIPHPGIPDRRFTLVPLHEIAPDLVDPVSRKTTETLLRECPDPLQVVVVRQ